MTAGTRAEIAPVLAAVLGREAGTAVVDAAGEHGYADLAARSAAVAEDLLEAAGTDDLEGARVAILAAPGAAWTAALLGAWRAGGIAVPLAPAHPDAELAWPLADTGCALVLADPDHAERLRGLLAEAGGAVVVLDPDRRVRGAGLPAVAADRDALVLYTSGTTDRPRGAVLTHANLGAQVASLVEAWEWTADDRLLHVLPLHHTHGIVNGVLCALASGATCSFAGGFDPRATWRRFASEPVTLFMAVPTVYRRLIDAWEAADPAERDALSAAARDQRVMISGSAALPVAVLERWREITGHTLLERYGMTEIGMALSNPLHGERRPGAVGRPLPGVEARLVDDDGRAIEAEGVAGEIEVRGPAVFRGYWNRPAETARAFRDGWFRTGDEAIVEDGAWRILGRRSVDIVKTGGEKVSALEVEDTLARHPAIAACAVVGAPDSEWGERVCAVVVPAPGAVLSLDELRAWARDRLAVYKIPTRLRLVDDLPRNAMGKVVKPALRELFERPEGAPDVAARGAAPAPDPEEAP